MKPSLIILILLINIFLPNTVYAWWFNESEEKEEDISNIVVKECIQILQEKSDKDKNEDVKIEVYAGDIKVLSEYVVLTKIIMLVSTNGYLTMQEKEGICRYTPEGQKISWQPIINI